MQRAMWLFLSRREKRVPFSLVKKTLNCWRSLIAFVWIWLANYLAFNVWNLNEPCSERANLYRLRSGQNKKCRKKKRNTRIIYHIFTTLFYPWGLINSISWMHYLHSLFTFFFSLPAKELDENYLTYSHAMHSSHCARWHMVLHARSLTHSEKNENRMNRSTPIELAK